MTRSPLLVFWVLFGGKEQLGGSDEFGSGGSGSAVDELVKCWFSGSPQREREREGAVASYKER